MDYYILNPDGERAGPYSIDQVRAMWANDRVTLGTLYWTEGLDEWRPLSEILNLALHNSGESENTDDILENLVRPPLIDGATKSSTSKIVMGIENFRRGEMDQALRLFSACLEETHDVAAGWLGLSLVEAFKATLERDSIEKMRSAMQRAGEHCDNVQLLRNCYVQILSVAIQGAVEAVNFGAEAYSRCVQKYLQSLQTANDASRLKSASFVRGTVAAALVGRSQNVVIKASLIGSTVLNASRAFEASSQETRSRLEAMESVNDSQTLYGYMITGAGFAASSLVAAKELSTNCSPRLRHRLSALEEPTLGIAKVVYGIGLKTFEAQLRQILPPMMKRSFNPLKATVPPEVRTLLRLGEDLRLSHLPIHQNVQSFFPDLVHLALEPQLIGEERYAVRRKRGLQFLMVALGFAGFGLWRHLARVDSTIGFDLVGMALCATAVVVFVLIEQAPLPKQAAVRARIEKLRKGIFDHFPTVHTLDKLYRG